MYRILRCLILNGRAAMSGVYQIITMIVENGGAGVISRVIAIVTRSRQSCALLSIVDLMTEVGYLRLTTIVTYISPRD